MRAHELLQRVDECRCCRCGVTPRRTVHGYPTREDGRAELDHAQAVGAHEARCVAWSGRDTLPRHHEPQRRREVRNVMPWRVRHPLARARIELWQEVPPEVARGSDE